MLMPMPDAKRARTVLAALAVFAVGVGGPLVALRTLGDRSDASPRQEASRAPTATGFATGTLPDVAEVECTAGGPKILTPEAQPLADGLHLRIRNVTGAEMTFSWPEGGFGVGPGVTEIALPVAPGEAAFDCFPFDGTFMKDPPTLSVVDEMGAYVPPGPDCSGAASVGMEGTGLAADDLMAEVQGSLVGLRQGDAIEAAGYPGSDTERSVRVVRDGRVIASLSFERLDGQWQRTGFAYCDDAGLSLG
jgi:hypothetical protein